jgi:hypothetical protein
MAKQSAGRALPAGRRHRQTEALSVQPVVLSAGQDRRYFRMYRPNPDKRELNIEDLWYSIHLILPPPLGNKNQIIGTPSKSVGNMQDSKS